MMASRITRRARALLVALAVAPAFDASAQSQVGHSSRYRTDNQDQQDQSYLDPGPAPVRQRVPNYVAIGQSDYSQPFYDSMADPGGSDFEVSPY